MQPPFQFPTWFDPKATYACIWLAIGEGPEGTNQMCRDPLIFDKGLFFLVLETRWTPDGEIPSKLYQLDENELSPPLKAADPWILTWSLERPRGL